MKVKKTKASNPAFPIVGIGSSAGGLEALREILSALPIDTGLSFVVIQHLDPTRESQTTKILSKDTDMAVWEIKDGLRVEPNNVYVIPSNFNLTILSDGTLNLIPRAGAIGRQTVIDLFFESLARSKQKDAIGVVLSGTGSDGTNGLIAIKAGGGTGFVQDPKSASYGDMPSSAIKSGAATFVLPPKEIAQELVKLSDHFYNRKHADAAVIEIGYEHGLPHDAVQKIFSLVLSQTHVDLSQYKQSTVNRRIQRQMRVHKLQSIEDYAAHLQTHSEDVKTLSEEMFIHVTEFFRDQDSFKSLGELVFPRLMKNRPSGVPLRVWVPGCSTGEEAYSIAISLIEFLGPKAGITPIQFFATDISEAAIQEARAGVYSEDQVERVRKDWIAKFFDRTKDGYKIKKFIRDLCVFSKHDVAISPPFAKIDLISCRNVLIYFGPTLQRQVMPIFHYSLNPDSFLWLGKSEAPTAFSKLFTLIDKTNKIYSKINTATPISFRFPTGQRPAELIGPEKKSVGHFDAATDPQREFDRVVSRYAPAGVIISSDMEVIQVRGRTAPFLEVPSGQPNYNISKMLLPELLPAVRMAVQSAMKQNAPVRKEGLAYAFGHKRNKVSIEVIPSNPLASPEERRFVLLFEKESDSQEKSKSGKKTVKKPARGKKKPNTQGAYIRQLLEELDSTRDYQQTLAEGYEAAQEELTSANEELQSANEELQSTNEEMETGKEELQAANEELTTINDELQNRNEELARSEERFRLLVEGVKEYAIFILDPEGRVTTWNEGAQRLKGYKASEIIGQHFSIFYEKVDVENGKPTRELKEAAQKGRVQDEGWRIRKDGSRFWASVIITKITDDKDQLLGFSKVTRDLTTQKEYEEKLRKARDELDIRIVERTAELAAANEALKKSESRLHQVIEATPNGLLMVDQVGKIVLCNAQAESLFGYNKNELLEKEIEVLVPSRIRKAHPGLRAGYFAKPEIRLMGAGRDLAGLRKDGSEFPVEIGLNPVRTAEGNFVLASVIDITERKISEQKLHEALSLRDEFLSIASHELKTPLTSLKLQLQLSERSFQDDALAPSKAEMSEAFALAIRQVNSLSELVEDLLDITRIQAGKFDLSLGNLNLTELVREIVGRFSEQLRSAGCPVELSLDENIVGMWDKHRIEQVLVNLLSNAIKYASKKPIHILTSRNHDSARLVVADSGPGIEKDKQPKIFERFERATSSTNVSGMGLGLYIVRKIVEAHQGGIRLESELGKGSKFIVELPLNPKSADVKGKRE